MQPIHASVVVSFPDMMSLLCTPWRHCFLTDCSSTIRTIWLTHFVWFLIGQTVYFKRSTETQTDAFDGSLRTGFTRAGQTGDSTSAKTVSRCGNSLWGPRQESPLGTGSAFMQDPHTPNIEMSPADWLSKVKQSTYLLGRFRLSPDQIETSQHHSLDSLSEGWTELRDGDVWNRNRTSVV
jgi:hypothetical protein